MTLRHDAIPVELTDREYIEAMRVASIRTQQAKEKWRKGKNLQPPNDKPYHDQIGALCERAYCKWIARPFSEMDTYPDCLREPGGHKISDFGKVDVKGRKKGYTFMLVRDDDPKDRIFVCASAELGDHIVTLDGWIHGSEIKQQWWGQHNTNRPPCYWIPESQLHSMSTFRQPTLFPKEMEP